MYLSLHQISRHFCHCYLDLQHTISNSAKTSLKYENGIKINLLLYSSSLDYSWRKEGKYSLFSQQQTDFWETVPLSNRRIIALAFIHHDSNRHLLTAFRAVHSVWMNTSSSGLLPLLITSMLLSSFATSTLCLSSLVEHTCKGRGYLMPVYHTFLILVPTSII